MERRATLTRQKEAPTGGGGVNAGSVIRPTASQFSVKAPPHPPEPLEC